MTIGRIRAHASHLLLRRSGLLGDLLDFLLQGIAQLEGGLDADQLAGRSLFLELLGEHLFPAGRELVLAADILLNGWVAASGALLEASDGLADERQVGRVRGCGPGCHGVGCLRCDSESRTRE